MAKRRKGANILRARKNTASPAALKLSELEQAKHDAESEKRWRCIP
jgi:hypothetical protein